MKSQQWLQTCESFSHFNVYFHSRGDCLSFFPRIQDKTFCQNHHHALTLSHRVSTVTKCFSSWHFISHLSNCHSGVTKSAVYDEKHNHEAKTLNILIFPFLQNGPRLMSALWRSGGVQRCGLTQWQGNTSQHQVLFVEFE